MPHYPGGSAARSSEVAKPTSGQDQGRHASVVSITQPTKPDHAALTLMMSLTPSRVSSASGTQLLNQPVANTRLRSDSTSCIQKGRFAGKDGGREGERQGAKSNGMARACCTLLLACMRCFGCRMGG